ncbi:hypothetical protein AURDEDRAFT_169917 [Auricularia subglabra TFB-10046 SS5]|uniref:Uncharacterized protein n=1 Tax=Auricularia subglabra (strain TFB-10046 / SS5) TaxID=717982 RepID=J0WYD9_AURST|nr:hypothetical protein AURDEDRAFT_169917 [Auricularia subglabra TFB-10046 SS5]
MFQFHVLRKCSADALRVHNRVHPLFTGHGAASGPRWDRPRASRVMPEPSAGVPAGLHVFLQPGVPVLHAAYTDVTLLWRTMSHVAFNEHGAHILLGSSCVRATHQGVRSHLDMQFEVLSALFN